MSALPPYLAPAGDALNKGDALAVVARGLGGTVHLAADVIKRALETREDAQPIDVETKLTAARGASKAPRAAPPPIRGRARRRETVRMNLFTSLIP